MLIEFWQKKKTNLQILIGLFLIALGAKLGFLGDFEESRYKLAVEFALWVLAPMALVWDWIDFKKNR